MKGLDVKVRDVLKVYRLGKVEVQALRGLNMDVKAGELISIIGPSGSGKTTLLNIIGGLDQATGGTVHVGNTEVTAFSTAQLVEYRRKTVGHIFQTLNLIPTLTAAENVELPMLALGAPRKKRTERVKELLEIVGLTDRAPHKPEELSGGEQQRVAMATALANDAPVLLADEPKNNNHGDPRPKRSKSSRQNITNRRRNHKNGFDSNGSHRRREGCILH